MEITKSDVVKLLESGAKVKYKGCFDVLSYNETDDSFMLLHKDDRSFPEFATPWKSGIIDFTRISYLNGSLSDKNNGKVFLHKIGGTMKNIEYKVQGNKLIIEIDTTQTHGKSKSGKNMIVATSAGNAKIEGTNLVLGLNLFTKDAE